MTPETERMLISILAYAYSVISITQKRWEHVLTHFVLGTMYVLAHYDVITGSNSMFGLRWSLLLLLFIEVLSFFARKYFDKVGNK